MGWEEIAYLASVGLLVVTALAWAFPWEKHHIGRRPRPDARPEGLDCGVCDRPVSECICAPRGRRTFTRLAPPSVPDSERKPPPPPPGIGRVGVRPPSSDARLIAEKVEGVATNIDYVVDELRRLREAVEWVATELGKRR